MKGAEMASARKSSRRSLPMLLNNGLQQPTRSRVIDLTVSSFGLTDDLDLYFIRQIASHMKVRSQMPCDPFHTRIIPAKSCNMPCRPCTREKTFLLILVSPHPTRFRQIFLLSL